MGSSIGNQGSVQVDPRIRQQQVADETEVRDVPEEVDAGAAEQAQQSQPDYVVKKGDTLWGIAKGLLEQGGTKATNGAVAKMVEDLKQANPHLTDAAHKGGDLIKPKEPVFFPKPQGWQAGAGTRPAQTGADVAPADDGAELAKQVAGAQQVFDNIAKALTGREATTDEKSRIADFVKQVETLPQEAMDELLGSPSAQEVLTKAGLLDSPAQNELAQNEAPVEQQPEQPAAPVATPAQAGPATGAERDELLNRVTSMLRYSNKKAIPTDEQERVKVELSKLLVDLNARAPDVLRDPQTAHELVQLGQRLGL